MITFLSNFINDHQIPFCNAMYKETNGNFRFVATELISEERLAMGFVDQSDRLPYIVKSFHGEAQALADNSDVVIIGSAPQYYIDNRLKQDKLTFRYTERYFKEGRWHILDPRVLRYRYRNDYKYRDKEFYVLCASAYTAPDMRFIHSYPQKTYRWGYFPEVKVYDDPEKIIRLKHPASILWAGRLIRLKHPEDAIYMAKKLRGEGIAFRLTIIGEGERKESIEKLIRQLDVTDSVQMEGFQPPAIVRKKMEESDIFLFTSDRNEGWGAVLNESMNSCCAVVANREIGSVPYLIADGENGLKYNRRDRDDLFKKVKTLLLDQTLKKRLQRTAYQTMVVEWNADVASARFLHLVDCIQHGKQVEYVSGPCSPDW